MKNPHRQLSENFLKLFLDTTHPFNTILDLVNHDDTLNMELRGDRVIVYYRGGAILTIYEKKDQLEGLDPNYHQGRTFISPSFGNMEDYLPKAKQIIDRYICAVKNHLGEKDIQQQIVRDNNYSATSLDTDYFIIDTEYQSGNSRFDIVALRWDSKSETRKLSKSYLPKITVFEVKQGVGSISGSSGLGKHLQDFSMFCKTSEFNAFKTDMIAVFNQKRAQGLIMEIQKYKEITQVAEEVDFCFILANYKPESQQLRVEFEKEDYRAAQDAKFIYANAMGYGLFARNIIGKDEFLNRFLCASSSIEASTK